MEKKRSSLLSIIKNTFSNKTVLFLVFLTIIGFIIRFYRQPELPYGFHRDEAGIAYSAYSILKTGKDEWGRLLPLHFKALGDYPPGGYNYLVTLTIPFLGLTELAERFPAILIGTILIPITYVFIKTFFKKERLAQLTTVLVTFSPWMVVQSRAGSEALTALFFSLIGFLFFHAWTRKKHTKYLVLVVLSYLMALFTYNATRVVLPLLHVAVMYFLWNSISVKNRLSQIIFAVSLFIISALSIFATSGNQMSFQNTSVFTHGRTPQQLEVIFTREGIAELPIFYTRMYTNKIINLGFDLAHLYLDYFDVSFLFNDGGFHKRYLVPQVGPILLILVPFIILGLFNGKLSTKEKQFLLLWLLIAPLGGAVTVTDAPNVKRALYLFIVLLIFAASGVDYLFTYLKNKHSVLAHTAFSILGLLYIFNFGFFVKQYIAHTPFETTRHRSFGYKEVYTYSESIKEKYDSIIFFEAGDTPHTYYLLYTSYPPEDYQKIPTAMKRDLFQPNKPVVQLNEYTFNPGECPDHQEIKPNILYIFKYGCLNDDQLSTVVQPLKTIYGPDMMPIFSIVEQLPQEMQSDKSIYTIL